MNVRLRFVAALLVGSWLLSASPAGAARAQGDCAYELIAAVNDLRASYGLAPYTVDPILMAVVQAQTEFRVATGGAYGHLGPNGERPRDRAIAAGYGAGNTVFVSENIIEGTDLTPAQAVEWWTGDEPHLNTMIGQYYRDIGAGCGFSGNYAYYTINSGYVAGGYSASGYYTTPAAGVRAVAPFFIATPAADGSITHTVAAGQTLWTIAAYYGVDLDTLRRLNGFGESPILHPGDLVIVSPAVGTPTATMTTTPEAPPPTATLQAPPPSRIPAPTPASPEAIAREQSAISKVLIGVGAALAITGVVLAIRRS
jgi:LysM repeat protein